MAQQEPPAPVVTIIDPTRPAALADGSAGAAPTPWLRPAERILATMLVLCLLAAWRGSLHLRAGLRTAAQLNGVGFDLVVLAGGPDAASRVTLAAQLVNTGAVPVTVRGLHLGGGWELLNDPPLRMAAHGTAVLGLRHAVDCAVPLSRPTQASIGVEVTGAGARTVPVAVSSAGMEHVFDTSALCGQLEPEDAVALRTSSVDGVGQGVSVRVQLVNTSISAVRVEDVLLHGFKVQARLPVTLPNRRPGLLDLDTLDAVELTMTAVVVDCRAGQEAMRAAAQSENPDAVELLVSGRGGTDIASVDVAGILDYLNRELRESCPGLQ